MTRRQHTQPHTVRTDFKSGHWRPDLVSQALKTAIQTNNSQDWITWFDICHALQGITNHDLLTLRNYCPAQQLQHSALRWRLANYENALHEHPGTPADSTSAECLIKQLCHEQSATGLFRKKLGLQALGSRAGDYPMLLALIASSASRILHGKKSRSAMSVQCLISKASSILSNTQDFDNSIKQLLPATTLAGNSQTIAVVGNSPSIKSSKPGAEIDACDIVVRFNQTNIKPSTAIHTGARTDIWVMSPSTPVQFCPKDTRTVVVSGVRPFLRPTRYWPALTQAPRISECPADSWYSLVGQLQAPPSAGLLILNSLKETGLNLDIRRYGFTETHGIHGMKQNHHADRTPVSNRHNWSREVQWIQENC